MPRLMDVILVVYTLALCEPLIIPIAARSRYVKHVAVLSSKVPR